MEPKSVLLSLRNFASRELKGKRADRADVRQVKFRSSMRKGRLPELRILTIVGAHYLVCVFRADDLRVYYMSKRGEMLGASDFAGAEKKTTLQEISKKTKTVFRLPSSS